MRCLACIAAGTWALRALLLAAVGALGFAFADLLAKEVSEVGLQMQAG
jgi:hypothetical protein